MFSARREADQDPGVGNQPLMRPKLYRGKWYAVWTEGGKTKRVSLRLADTASSEAARREIEALRQPVSLGTIGPLVETYLAVKSDPGSNGAWKPLASHFSDVTPDTLGASIRAARDRGSNDDIVSRYVAKARMGGHANGTIRRGLGVLRAALRFHRGEYDPVAALIALPPPGDPRHRVLSRDEFKALRDAAVTAHMKLYITLALATAARPTALLELTWDRVDLERNRIDLGKGSWNKLRSVVPIPDFARTALLEAKKGSVCETVIEYGGKPVRSIKHGFAAACARAGFTDVIPYTLRHTAATWMAMRGVPLVEIARYLGHEDTRTTYRVYAKYQPSYLKDAAAALDPDA